MTLKEIIRLKMNSKVTGGYGGGGSHTHTFKGHTTEGSSFREKVYNADIVLMSSRHGIEIYKNRYDGNIGPVTAEEFMELSLRLLAKKLYNGLTEVFQEGFITEAKKALEKVLKEHSKVERIKD